MADTIKIAIAGPETGTETQYGDMQFTGVKQAIKDINARGGIDGKMVEAKEYDDGGDARQAVAVANKIVNDGVKFVIGHMASVTTQPASDIYEDEGVIMITPGATDPEITARGYRLIFRTVAVDSTQDPAAGNSFAKDPQNKAIVDAIKADGKDPNGLLVFPAYAAVELIAEGIKAAKSEDTDKVAKELHSGTFKTSIGTISFDEKGDLKD
ncbi:ABC transporter substrate-binding protein [Streptomyces sp. NPDC006512]|uniref:ABC transporter substrate-binding protein n=1 Tax=Streptomyces sp. NPDC006512 TaxID=3154307 RepID=UPI0033AB24A2